MINKLPFFSFTKSITRRTLLKQAGIAGGIIGGTGIAGAYLFDPYPPNPNPEAFNNLAYVGLAAKGNELTPAEILGLTYKVHPPSEQEQIAERTMAGLDGTLLRIPAKRNPNVLLRAMFIPPKPPTQGEPVKDSIAFYLPGGDGRPDLWDREILMWLQHLKYPTVVPLYGLTDEHGKSIIDAPTAGIPFDRNKPFEKYLDDDVAQLKEMVRQKGIWDGDAQLYPPQQKIALIGKSAGGLHSANNAEDVQALILADTPSNYKDALHNLADNKVQFPARWLGDLIDWRTHHIEDALQKIKGRFDIRNTIYKRVRKKQGVLILQADQDYLVGMDSLNSAKNLYDTIIQKLGKWSKKFIKYHTIPGRAHDDVFLEPGVDPAIHPAQFDFEKASPLKDAVLSMENFIDKPPVTFVERLLAKG